MSLARTSNLLLRETSFGALARPAFSNARVRTALPAARRLNRAPFIRHFQHTTDTQKKPPNKESRAPKIDRSKSKLFKDADEAVKDLQSDSIIFSAGFGLCGTAGM